MRTNELRALVALVALFACGTALAGSKADIVVMTQNQYLGAELTPIIAAEDPATANAAMITALTALSNNNYLERVEALAGSIRGKKPHLVALQEVYAFHCHNPFGTEVPLGRDACELFPNAFNDHLAETMAALGDKYEVAAVVQNLTLAQPALPILGIPLILDEAQMPVFIEVIDRDVILARADVDTAVVTFDCGFKPSVDGCNYMNVAPASVGPFDFNIERGFVGVDATIGGVDYRFINTHLEVKMLGDSLPSTFLQPAQASELWGAILATFDPSKRLIVAGDFNSSPVDVSPIGVVTAYQQLTSGQSIFGDDLPFRFTDTWYLRLGKPPGFTCCELADLSNAPSQHYERIDLVLTFPAPSKVKANVLGDEVDEKTLSGLWPSDHASVSAELTY
jgi:endonuclease/exonuclease/phosphatase family metal-dependent hydrolase